MNARKFLILVLSGFLSLTSCAAALVFITDLAGRSPFPYKALFEYQTEKLESGDIKTLFVGDSSLGNSIDAAEWSRLSGTKTANVALTGKFGYGGSMNMIRRALKHNPNIKTVIVMQTPDMMTRPPAHELYALSLPEGEANFTTYAGVLREKLNLQEIRNSLSWIRNLLKNGRMAKKPNLIINDYIPQAEPKDFSSLQGIHTGGVRKDKAFYLEKLKKLCAQTALECFYAHGPLASPRCERSTAYIKTVNAMIDGKHLQVIPETPVCIPPEHYGDSADHVAPAYKKEYTRRYYKLYRQTQKSK